MLVPRAVSFTLLTLLILIASSTSDFVRAVDTPAVASYVCHDEIWAEGEYCGRDAFATTGVPDMNHDCVADALDLMLFINIIFSSEPSGDFNNDGVTDYTDFIMLKHQLGNVASPCNSVPIPNVVEGTIRLSFDSDPNVIDDNENQALVGSHVVWVVVDNIAGAKSIEYSIETTTNVIVLSHFATTTSEYTNSCLPDSLKNLVLNLYQPLGPGPQVIAGIQYFINDLNPATIKIVPNNCAGRMRWTEPDVALSHHFGTITNAGINGPTPEPTEQTVVADLVGSAAGNIYADVDGDCVNNGTDYPAAGIRIQANPGPYLTQTDAAGNYKFWLPAGNYTVKLVDGVNDPWKLRECQPATSPFTIVAGNDVPGPSIALKSVGTITGRVYRDYIGDCVFNTTDYPIVNRMIEIDPGGYIVYTDAQGYYSATLPIGDYTVTQAVVTNDIWLLQGCQVASYNVTVPQGGTAGNRDFALLYNGPPECGVSVSVFWNRVTSVDTTPSGCHGDPFRSSCPGWESEYKFVVKADPQQPDPIPSGALLTMTMDPAFTISSVTSDCDFTVVSTSGGNEQTIAFSDEINPGQTCVVTVLATPSTDGPYETEVSFDDGLCIGVKNASFIEQTLCSCDPNDKAVLPEGCGPNGNVQIGEPLTYKIRFENVGPGTAHNIFIEDVLDADLDVSTLDVVSASHTVTGVQIDPGNKLVLSFDDIELAGTVGPGDPKGWVVFTIDPKPDLLDGTTIENTAAITFDFNEPVVTNTTVNTYRTVPEPDAAFTVQAGCDGNSQIPTVDFTYSGSTPDNATYLWNFGPGASPPTSTAQNPSGVQFSTPGTKQVTLTVTRFGCAVSVVDDIVAGPCDFICHNGTWSDGEYCGYDAYTTTGVPDMNHNCTVDALDVWLLGAQIPMSGSNLSGDLNGDNSVNSADLTLLIGEYGESVGGGCNNTALPDTCQGTIAISFLEYPDFIVDNATMTVGSTHHAFIVVKDAPGAKMVSYAIEASPNVVIDNHTALGGSVVYSCNPASRIVNLSSPLTSSPVFVGMIDFHLTNSSPATLKVKPMTSGTACDNRIRWAKASANRSNNFMFVTNGGINGPTPDQTPNSCTPTAVQPREMPLKEELAQNRPNPFNPVTTIQYALAATDHVTIRIFDIRGALVRVLVDETQPAGWHSVEWNGRDHSGQPVASGVYLCRMMSGTFADTKKLVLLK